jgi:chaperone required for assembly of F1-ATPase
MKRFWKEVEAAAVPDGVEIRLDGRPLRTPAGRHLLLPSARLAEAVADEWQAVAGRVDPAAMPLTGLANAAIDHAATDRHAFAQALSAYAESDLLCYRADHPAPLVARQAAAWDPLLGQVEGLLGVRFAVRAGVMFAPQPEAALAAVRAAFSGFDPWQLAALQPIVTIAGSALIGVALAHGLVAAPAAFAAGNIDEDWQAEQWGEDAEARTARDRREWQFMAAARMLALLAA